MKKFFPLFNKPIWLLLLLCSVVFLVQLVRTTGLYPTVFPDEDTYSTLSRLVPLDQSPVPMYLYFWIYSFTNHCGDGFLDCARILNSLFFVSGAVFVYLIARRVMPGMVAVLVAGASILGPLGIYTAYFMPENLYFLGFWILAWGLIGLDENSRIRQWLLPGFVFGCLSLVKPHSLFLVPAIAIYIVYLGCGKQVRRPATITMNAAAFFIAAAAAKFLLGYLFAGNSAFTIFGPLYSEIASLAGQNPDVYFRLAEFASLSFGGHAMAIALLYGVPVFVTMSIVIESLKNGDANRAPLNRISLFAILVVSNLVLVTAAFSALARLYSEEEFLLHMRYYNFALPLFYIVAASAMFSKRARPGAISTVLLASLTCLACYAVGAYMAPFVTGSNLHSPDIHSVSGNEGVFYVFGGLSILALLLCFWRTVSGARTYVCLVVPFLVASAFNMIEGARSNALSPGVGARAGLFARDYLSPNDRDKLLIVGSYPRYLYNAAFHVNSAGVSVDSRWPYDFSKLPAGKEWVLFVDDPVPAGSWFSQVLPMNGFTLARVARQ
ncbi:MAG: glycosyltransferase family 39 protein [Candidatus Accumulibacter sp.]|nr:glycosyltransferase family 39 protein [Accumulibacter sp.]